MISNIGSQKSNTSSFLVPNGKDHKSDLANHACFIRLDPFIHPSIHSSILPLIHRFVCFESVASFIWNLYHVHYQWCDTRPFSLTLLSTYLDQLENGLGLGQMEHEHGKGQSTWDTDIDVEY